MPIIKRIFHPFAVLPLFLTLLVSCEQGPVDPEQTTNKLPAIESEQNEVDTQQQPAEFQALFDGVSLNGWHGYGGRNAGEKWRAANGVLEFQDTGDKPLDLVSDREFENFDLRLEWRISAGGNSGIMFNVVDSPEYRKPWHTGPEVQLLDNDKHADGKTPAWSAAALYDLVIPPLDATKPVGEWNESRLRVEDGFVQHWLNGTLTFEIQMWDEAWNALVAASKFAERPGFGRYRAGHIVLQDHGDDVAFRNIRIREL